MRLEQKACHHAEVAPAAAQRPEEIGARILTGRDDSTIGQDDVCLEQVVNRQPELAGEVPRAPAEGEAPDTGARDDAKRYCQSERMGGMIDIS